MATNGLTGTLRHHAAPRVIALRGPNRMFDLHPDGRRFAVAPAQSPDGVKRDHLGFVFNFFDELERLVPTAAK